MAGIVDDLQKVNIKAWGPTAYCANLEGSKAFAKDFMIKHNIPTAKYQTFSDETLAIDYIKEQGTPIVIKADGLAAGKGVVVAMNDDEAISAIRDMLSGNKFGDAGSTVVIEDFLTGEEASFICMIDGKHILPMATKTTNALVRAIRAPMPAVWAPTRLHLWLRQACMIRSLSA